MPFSGKFIRRNWLGGVQGCRVNVHFVIVVVVVLWLWVGGSQQLRLEQPSLGRQFVPARAQMCPLVVQIINFPQGFFAQNVHWFEVNTLLDVLVQRDLISQVMPNIRDFVMVDAQQFQKFRDHFFCIAPVGQRHQPCLEIVQLQLRENPGCLQLVLLPHFFHIVPINIGATLLHVTNIQPLGAIVGSYFIVVLGYVIAGPLAWLVLVAKLLQASFQGMLHRSPRGFGRHFGQLGLDAAAFVSFVSFVFYVLVRTIAFVGIHVARHASFSCRFLGIAVSRFKLGNFQRLLVEVRQTEDHHVISFRFFVHTVVRE